MNTTTGVQWYLSEMPLRNDITKMFASENAEGIFQTIVHEFQTKVKNFNLKNFEVGTLYGHKVYAFDMRPVYGSTGKSFSFFTVGDKVGFAATFYYRSEIRAWVEDEVFKSTSAPCSLEDFYKFLLKTMATSFNPKRIAGDNHSKGMEKSWKRFAGFGSEVWEREKNGRSYKLRKDLNFFSKGIWSEPPNNYFVVIELK
jgi:hypothetical protein